MVEMELGVSGENRLAGHQIRFFHMGIELDYVSQPPLQFDGSYDQVLAHRTCGHVCYSQTCSPQISCMLLCALSSIC